MRKIIQKIAYSSYAHSFFGSNNIPANFILKKINLFQRKFIKFRDPNIDIEKNNNDYIAKYSDLQKPGEKFQYLSGVSESVKLKDFNSVAGWVPFEKGNTEISIYNFFGKNYSIRKQLIGTICFVRDKKIVLQKWFLLPVDCIKFLNFKSLDLNADYVFVEIFHPKIPKNHGKHNGHLRFHGIFGNNSAIVHSMPVENFYYKKNNLRSLRRYFPKWILNTPIKYQISISNLFEKKKIHNTIHNDLFGDYSLKTLSPLGFSLIKSEKNSSTNNLTISSVFHDSALSNSDHKPEFKYQLISIPKIKNINATIYFTEAISKKENISITFYDLQNKKVKNCILEIKKYDEVNLIELYKTNIDNLSFVIVELLDFDKSYHLQYINVLYSIDGRLCDNVHAHSLEDQRCLKGRQTIKHNNQYSGLKWMPFPEQEKFKSYMIIINGTYPLNFKLRVILDNFEEYIVPYSEKYSVDSLGQIAISLKDIFEDYSISLKSRGIIQLECKNYNPTANLFTYSEENQSLSVDHFTGG